jgi:hypothetical protein
VGLVVSIELAVEVCFCFTVSYSVVKQRLSGFGGLVVSMLASGTQDRGFAPDRSRENILNMPSFGGEIKHLSHVPALGHVKEPSCFVNYEFAS